MGDLMNKGLRLPGCFSKVHHFVVRIVDLMNKGLRLGYFA